MLEEKTKRISAARRILIRVTYLAIVLAVISGLAFLGFHLVRSYYVEIYTERMLEEIINNGYVPIYNSMRELGYKAGDKGEYSFVKLEGGMEIEVTFDVEEGVSKKNGYTFEISDSLYASDGTFYIKSDRLRDIVNRKVFYSNGILMTQRIVYDRHGWTEAFPPVVAHAGGGMRGADYNDTYTNSLEAMIQNYDMGHRIFEIDFCMTSDGRMAAIHDWKLFGNEDGEAMSSEQWKAFRAQEPENQYTTMLLEDVLDQMVINKDMFLITDTKVRDTTGNVISEQFQMIYDEAMKRDSKLVKRIIPQIYNRAMYDIVTQVYSFPSIIFTLYATKETEDEVVEFAEAHTDVKVVTTWGYGERMTDEFIRRMRDIDKLIYAHTQNTYEDITKLLGRGVHGIYTDFLTPKDFEIYKSVRKTQIIDE